MGKTGAAGDSLENTLNGQIERGPWILGKTEVDRIAALTRRAARSASTEDLAVFAGCELRREPELPSGVDAALSPDGILLARPHEELPALHGIARWLLRSVPHSGADVGRLTLQLAARPPP